MQRYELEVSSTDLNSGYSRLASPSAAARSYIHSGLSPGSTRYYQLRACNSAGCGNLSFPAEATTSPAGVPSAPGLTASTTGSGRSGANGRSRCPGAGPTKGPPRSRPTSWTTVPTVATGSFWAGNSRRTSRNTCTRSTSTPGETHRYRVRAVNELGESAWSAVRSVTIPARPPFMPYLSFGVSTDSTITLNWTVPEANGSLITGYRGAAQRPGPGTTRTWKTIANVGVSPTTYTDGNLWQGEYYCYQVAANSNMGLGEYSFSECEFTTGEICGSTGSSHPAPEQREPHRVTVAWDPPRDDGGGR